MADNPLLSVIVPIYNTEQYLRRCLDSIVNQTYTNLEIILIDDGSTDKSGDIADEYAGRDERIKVIHQINQGESSARNRGIDLITGDYFSFVDCDDWIDDNMYEVMIAIGYKAEADIIVSRWYKSYNDRDIEIMNSIPVENDELSKEELLRYIYMRDAYKGFAYMWDKIYKTELLNSEAGKVYFDETLKLGGDVLFLAQMALNTKRAIYIDKAFYHYFQREESGCHTENLSAHRDWIKAYEYTIDKLTDESIEKEIIDYAKRFLAYHAMNAAGFALKQKDAAYYKIFKEFMHKYSEEYITLNKENNDRIEKYRQIMSGDI